MTAPFSRVLLFRTRTFWRSFLIEGGTAHFGRIAGLTFDTAGALLLSDDTDGMIYRVSYGQ